MRASRSRSQEAMVRASSGVRGCRRAWGGGRARAVRRCGVVRGRAPDARHGRAVRASQESRRPGPPAPEAIGPVRGSASPKGPAASTGALLVASSSKSIVLGGRLRRPAAEASPGRRRCPGRVRPRGGRPRGRRGPPGGPGPSRRRRGGGPGRRRRAAAARPGRRSAGAGPGSPRPRRARPPRPRSRRSPAAQWSYRAWRKSDGPRGFFWVGPHQWPEPRSRERGRVKVT